MRLPLHPAICIASLFLFSPSPHACGEENRGTLGIYMENDWFGGTDRHYTSGVKLSWTSPDLEQYSDSPYASPFLPMFDLIRFISPKTYQKNLAFALGQTIYTPGDITLPELLPDDRPYAAWLYLGLGVVWKNEQIRNTLALNIGMVGPWAFGEETQSFVHDQRDINRAQGWDHQLRNELGLVIVYERTWRWLARERRRGWDWEILPYAGVALGNVFTHAAAGVELRGGWNLPDDFGTTPIGPSATTSTPVEGAPGKSPGAKFGFYFFTRIEGRAIARNIFLDGNTFGDSHSVDALPFVGNLSLGLSTNYKNTKLAYAYVLRSKEFRGQKDEQIFGTLSLNWEF